MPAIVESRAMARRRLEGLERVLGVNALFSTAYGNVGSSIYYALGLVAALALGLTPVVFLLTGALFYCTATTYAEATAMFPEAGGSSLFVRRAFNEFWSFFTAWAQMLNYVITIAISAFFAAGYFGGVAGEWADGPEARVLLGVALIAVLALVNVRGVKDAVAVNVVLAVVDFLSQLGLVLLGVFLVLDLEVLQRQHRAVRHRADLAGLPHRHPDRHGRLHGHRDDLEHGRGGPRRGGDDPRRDQARDDRRLHDLLHAAVGRALGPAGDAGRGRRVPDAARRPLRGGRLRGQPDARHRHGDGARARSRELYVGVLAVTILVAATNAGVLGVSRLVYSMGMHRQMPDGMRRLHPHFRTPYIGILVFSAIAALALLPGQAEFLGAIYAFGAMLSFSMAHLAVLRLRVTQPEHERPYRSPGRLRIRGHDLPPFAVLGLAGTASSLLVVSALDLQVAAAGTAWLLLGMATYIAYRRRQGLDLVSTHKVAIAEPVVDHEAEYDSVLVHVGDGRFDEGLLATAIKLAARRRRGIHVLVTITVPNALDIDAPMAEAEAAAETVIEQARLQGGRRVSGHWEKVRAGQAGRRIIEEAQDMRAAAVVLALPRRIAGTSIFGSTLETVLAERPCRVVIESRPEHARPGRSQA